MTWAPDGNALCGVVAVVAGATRGAGRGIALGLGEAGATVICTGRSSRNNPIASDYPGRAETIEETAELVTQVGGIAIAAVVDHLDTVQVERLARTIENDHGHIDVLVNDIWGAEILKGGPAEWNTPLWEHDLEAFDTTEATWRSSSAPPGFATSESPRYIGRGVAAIAADLHRARWNQQSLTVGDLADHYGFTDTDGSQPDA
jgi:hypothetical protein